jgi:NAD-dependent DNA ligase
MSKKNGKPLQGMSLCLSFEKDVLLGIERIAVQLGAKVTGGISKQNTTCLVTSKVGDDLYREAILVGLPVVKQSWLEDCWQRKTLIMWDQHTLPMFAGLQFCCTRIGPRQRAVLIEHIEANGGKYADQLENGKTTHLIAADTEGDKFSAAVRWKTIKVVTSTWVMDCVQRKSKF